MKTRSLRVVARELNRLWANGSAPTLYRIGENQFLVAEEPPAGVYLYGLGFSPSGTPEHAGVNPGTSAVSERSRKTALLIITAGALGLVLVLLLVLLGLGGFQSQSGAGALGVVSSNPKVTGSKVNLECSPEPGDFKIEAAGVAVSDLRVGGIREQIQSLTCAGATKYFRVRFYLDAGTWKAESAAPMGPHFQN
jgi:hypothetical protein